MPANPANNKTKTVNKSVAKKAETGKKSVGKKVPVRATKKPANVQEGGEEDQKTQSNRFFKIVSKDGSTHGRFSGKKPKQAANKALTSLLKENKAAKKEVKGVINFSIIECTRGSKHKTYDYEGQRKKLPEKMTVTIDDKKIVYEFTNAVKKAPKAAKPVVEGGAKKAAPAKAAAKKPAARKPTAARKTTAKAEKSA